MQFQQFEDLTIWKLSKAFLVRLNQIINSGAFNNDYNLINQIQRAGIAILANIAEGYERQTKKEFIQYLYIAKGSAGEVRSLLYLAQDLDYLDEENFDEMYKDLIAISKAIAGLIRHIQNDLKSGH